MLITKARLEKLASQERNLRKATASTILHESAISSERAYDIFLSHCSMDAEDILGAKALLEEYGFSVYVDWIDDPQLVRTRVNTRSANVIRSRMQSSTMLLYAHSINASYSKWCPWELGFFDGEKGGNVFILPVASQPKHDFEGQEYLGLYPYVDEAPSKAGIDNLWINYGKVSHNLREARTKIFEPL